MLYSLGNIHVLGVKLYSLGRTRDNLLKIKIEEERNIFFKNYTCQNFLLTNLYVIFHSLSEND